MSEESEDAVQNYIDVNSRSQMMGVVLTVIFGPLGLFYSSWIAALILCVVVVATVSTILVPIVCWITSVLLSLFFVPRYNKKVEAQARLMKGSGSA